MPRDVQSILQLRVPVIVRLGHRRMALDDILALGPGAIIELPKHFDTPLDLMVNNKVIGQGAAVKVGENFGLRVSTIGQPADRIQALASAPQP
jgi:flagellar motor switch protein FliN/FliY